MWTRHILALTLLLVGCDPVPLCGDGVVAGREACDDGLSCLDGTPCVGNVCPTDPSSVCLPKSNDGCSAACQIELCGNGELNPGEQCDDFGVCDDGRTCEVGESSIASCEALLSPGVCRPGSNDGCSNTCQIELCGNGILDPRETCDDLGVCDDGTRCAIGDNIASCEALSAPGVCTPKSNDGCSSTCQREPCGNGVLDPGEQCDDGPSCFGFDTHCALNGSGIFVCPTSPDLPCVPADNDGCSSTCQNELDCGNGLLDGGESCDDAKQCSDGAACTSNAQCSNTIDQLCLPRNGDGCSSVCANEAGFVCNGQPSVCTLPNCGDGSLNTGEGCDDGNNINGDGCLANCSVQAGFSCVGEPSSCTANAGTCGNFVIEFGEQCDNGERCQNLALCSTDAECTGIGDGLCNPRAQTDGCDAFCQLESCGDNTVNSGETCDNGKQCSDGVSCSNNFGCFQTVDKLCLPRDGDGCSAQCQSETCGDGVVAAGEACDNGKQCSNGNLCTANTDCFFPADGICAPRSGDGCQSDCSAVEPNFLCTGSPSQCFGEDCATFNFVAGAQLQFCPLVGQDLTGLNLTGANLSNADLSNSILVSANFSNTLFNFVTNFTNADLSGATGQPRNAGQATYSNTLCPNGANSSVVGGSCVGQGF